jgi:hypothetical protein
VAELVCASLCYRLNGPYHLPVLDELDRRINKILVLGAAALSGCLARIPFAPDTCLCHFSG